MLIVAESIFWTSLGIFLLRGKFVTAKTPKLLGRLLYWIGIPWQILALVRRSDFTETALLPPAVAIVMFLVGMCLALVFWNLNSGDRHSRQRLLRYWFDLKIQGSKLQKLIWDKNQQFFNKNNNWGDRHDSDKFIYSKQSKSLATVATSELYGFRSEANSPGGDLFDYDFDPANSAPALGVPWGYRLCSDNRTVNRLEKSLRIPYGEAVPSMTAAARLRTPLPVREPGVPNGQLVAIDCQASKNLDRASKGSFVLASMLGNTGFIGLAVAPALVNQAYWSWIVIYGVAHNVLGSYGLGVVLANHYSRSQQQGKWRQQLYHIFTIPSLWAFILGWWSKGLWLPNSIEAGIQTSSLFVVPGAFLLIGMQLSTIHKIANWREVLSSTAIKIIVLPLLAGLGLTLMGVSGDGRLALVVMSGMPTAFVNVILAEQYDLNRQIAASTILFSTVAFPLILPLWWIFFK